MNKTGTGEKPVFTSLVRVFLGNPALSLDDLERDFAQSPADYWMNRFGDDPVRG